METNKEYLFKQMMVWTDFSQHQNREGKECSQIFQQLEDWLYATIANLLQIEDPDLLIFISSLVDGLVISQMYSHPASIPRQGKLLAKMLTAYLESDAASA